MAIDPLSEPILALTEEVEDAIADRRPLVALESTLLAHGLPAEHRERVAIELERIVRDEGAVPATIAIIDGRMCVGLSAEKRARVVSGVAKKASTRDLAVALAEGGVHATTVAATIAVAERAGIRVMATGGIGGVHRAAEHTFDESADLVALARYRVAVVCAGPKAVLDLPRTLERLETLGVPVVGFGTDELPAFYSPESGLLVPARVDGLDRLARIVRLQIGALGNGGLLVVQPPPPSVAWARARVEALIEAALERANVEGVRGREVTPYLLSTLDRASGGGLMHTNIALVEENARLAARLAKEDARLGASATD